jgi:hypothetical protein
MSCLIFPTGRSTQLVSNSFLKGEAKALIGLLPFTCVPAYAGVNREFGLITGISALTF